VKKSNRVLVLGAGIVGRAAVWDLGRRGYEVTVADADTDAAENAAAAYGASPQQLDASDRIATEAALSTHDAVVAAVPYMFGFDLATSAIHAGCHYFDFGGNPTVVKQQLSLDGIAKRHDVAVVPDCGLAPGLANVLAAGMIEDSAATAVDSVQIRVGCLPQHPSGTLEYQLAFYPGGLINEYVERCEVISNGMAATVEPLTRFEHLEWPGWGTLEAFATAGGTSTMCQDYLGIVTDLEYKTIRYPGHGRIFRAMAEIGLLQRQERPVDGVSVAPRRLLENLLADNLPRDEPDVVLLRVATAAAGTTTTLAIEDRHDGVFSALARTTAFPATALCDLVLCSDVTFRGAAAMHNAVRADVLMEDLGQVGLTATTI
jgi:lysine 6-dehydrogenase